MEQLVLEPVVHRKRRHCLRRYTVETWEVLGAGQGEDERAWQPVQRREEGRGIGGKRDGGRVTASAEGERRGMVLEEKGSVGEGATVQEERDRGGVGDQGGEGQREGMVVDERTQWRNRGRD